MFQMQTPDRLKPVVRFRFNEDRKSVEKVGADTLEKGDVEVRVHRDTRDYSVHLCTVANSNGYTFMPVCHIKEPLLTRTMARARRYCASSGRVTKYLKRHGLSWSKKDDLMLAEGDYACYSLRCYSSPKSENEYWVLTTFPYVTQEPPTWADKYNTCTLAKRAAEDMENKLTKSGGLL